jgi:uncharacterized membrane protein YGL010W
MTDALRAHFADYAAFHQTPGNRLCHSFGIPIIVLSSLSLLARVPLFTAGGVEVTLAEPLIFLFVAYYLTLDAALAAFMLITYALLDVAGRQIPLVPALALFVLGWVLQGIGHYIYEKKSPAFFRNFAHLGIGQLWILAKAIGRT